MLIVGENTFVTIEEADTYFDSQLDGENWAALTIDIKNKSLTTAYSRILAYCTFTFEADAAPDNVKIAQSEYALELATISLAGAEGEVDQQLKKLVAGPAEMEFYENEEAETTQGGISDYIKMLLNISCDCNYPSADSSQGQVFV